MITVLANGCFDLIHAGHVAHLRAARAMGERLVVALTMDEHVNKGPGRPVYPWEQRAAILRELRCVDEVVPSESGAAAVLAVKPAVYCKGIDYVAGMPDDTRGEWQATVMACARVGAEIRFTRTAKLSTTEVIKRIAA